MEIERQRKQIIMKNLPTIFIESILYLCVSFHARLSYLTFSTGIDFRTLKPNRFKKINDKYYLDLSENIKE